MGAGIAQVLVRNMHKRMLRCYQIIIVATHLPAPRSQAIRPCCMTSMHALALSSSFLVNTVRTLMQPLTSVVISRSSI